MGRVVVRTVECKRRTPAARYSGRLNLTLPAAKCSLPLNSLRSPSSRRCILGAHITRRYRTHRALSFGATCCRSLSLRLAQTATCLSCSVEFQPSVNTMPRTRSCTVQLPRASAFTARAIALSKLNTSWTNCRGTDSQV